MPWFQVDTIGGDRRQIHDVERDVAGRRAVIGGPVSVALHEAQPQGVVVREQRPGRLCRRCRVETVGHFQECRLVEVLRIGERLFEEPGLHRRQRRGPLDRTLFSRHVTAGSPWSYTRYASRSSDSVGHKRSIPRIESSDDRRPAPRFIR